MKIVQQNTQSVFHLFSNKAQSEARNQTHSVYFNDNSLYSFGWHYKLGLHLKGGAILINNRGYSVTTSKHISDFISSSRHLTQFKTNDILLKFALVEVEEIAKKIPRARANKQNLFQRLEQIKFEFFRFQEYIKENKIDYVRLDNNTREPLTIDKRSKDFKRFSYILNSFDSIEFQEEIKEANTRARAKKQAQKLEQIKKFYSKGQVVRGLDFDLLRLHCDIFQNEIEIEPKFIYSVQTSQNVVVKLEQAISIINALNLISWDSVEANEMFKGSKIGHYTINRVSNDVFYIGCHKIKFEEVRSLEKYINKEYQACEDGQISTNLDSGSTSRISQLINQI